MKRKRAQASAVRAYLATVRVLYRFDQLGGCGLRLRQIGAPTAEARNIAAARNRFRLDQEAFHRAPISQPQRADGHRRRHGGDKAPESVHRAVTKAYVRCKPIGFCAPIRLCYRQSDRG